LEVIKEIDIPISILQCLLKSTTKLVQTIWTVRLSIPPPDLKDKPWNPEANGWGVHLGNVTVKVVTALLHGQFVFKAAGHPLAPNIQCP